MAAEAGGVAGKRGRAGGERGAKAGPGRDRRTKSWRENPERGIVARSGASRFFDAMRAFDWAEGRLKVLILGLLINSGSKKGCKAAKGEHALLHWLNCGG